MVTADQLTNEHVCQLLDKYLHIDARPNFAAADAPAPIEQTSKRAVSKVSDMSAITFYTLCWKISHGTFFVQVASAGAQHSHSNMSVSDFIAATLPLLEMEKNAEVAQVLLLCPSCLLFSFIS